MLFADDNDDMYSGMNSSASKRAFALPTTLSLDLIVPSPKDRYNLRSSSREKDEEELSDASSNSADDCAVACNDDVQHATVLGAGVQTPRRRTVGPERRSRRRPNSTSTPSPKTPNTNSKTPSSRLASKLDQLSVFSPMSPSPGRLRRRRRIEDLHVDMNLSVFVVTWNMQGTPGPDDLSTIIDMANNSDVFAIGTQECLTSIAKAFFFPSKDKWERKLQDNLGSDYVMISSKTMQALHLAVFVKVALVSEISEICIEAVPTGLFGIIGNKGGIGIRFRCRQHQLLFVNVHLAAHQHKTEARNKSCNKIRETLATKMTVIRPCSASSTATATATATAAAAATAAAGHVVKPERSNSRLKKNVVAPAPISEAWATEKSSMVASALIQDKIADHIFWFGDLNYRIESARQDVLAAIEKMDLESLSTCDQLNDQRRKGQVLNGFHEGEISFPPTYKFRSGKKIQSHGHGYNDKRIPSWTDRILYRTNHFLEQVFYYSLFDVTESDHRPVVSLFRT